MEISHALSITKLQESVIEAVYRRTRSLAFQTSNSVVTNYYFFFLKFSLQKKFAGDLLKLLKVIIGR
jgi:hypothetical protein